MPQISNVLISLDAGIKMGGAEKNVLAICNEIACRVDGIYLVAIKKNQIYYFDRVSGEFVLKFSFSLLFSLLPKYILFIFALNQIKFDLVISFLPESNIRVCILKSIGLVKSKVILFERNSISQRKRSSRIELGRMLFYRYAEFLTGNTAAICRDMKRYGSHLDITYYPNHVSCPVPNKAFNGVNGSLRLLAGGRLVPQKGINVIVEAFKRIYIESDLLIVVGDGPELDSLKKLACDSQSIRFMGQMDSRDILAMDFDILVMASKYEGAPNMALEALERGRMVIMATCEFSDEFGEFGALTVFDGSVGGLENALREFRSMNQERRSDILRAGEKFYNYYFEWSSDVHNKFWDKIFFDNL